LVLKTIYDQGPISRADIARLTQLTRTTVSSVVADLVEQGLVEESGYGPSEGGKPPILLRVVDDSRFMVGIDLASDEFRGAIVNLRGALRRRVSLPLRGWDGEAALALAYELIDDLVGGSEGPLLGIGIGAPGLMDPMNGVVRQAVNLDWQGLPLRSLLRERYGLPVYVVNDCQMAAMAEYTFGEYPDTDNLVVVKIEHGIGAGIILNGRLYHGDTFGAGEIGHATVIEKGQMCRCGRRGCLETVASVRSIIGQAQAIARRDPGSLLHQYVSGPEEITMQVICRAAQAGDQAIRQVIEQAGRCLGAVIANMIGVISVRRVVIAGSITCLGSLLLDVIQAEMSRRLLALVASQTEVCLSTMEPDIVIVGASALVLTRELGLASPPAGGL
jgi:predicted NBD/HSP70 family sugar kinase